MTFAMRASVELAVYARASRWLELHSHWRAPKTALTGQTYLQRVDMAPGPNANAEGKAQRRLYIEQAQPFYLSGQAHFRQPGKAHPFADHCDQGGHLGCL